MFIRKSLVDGEPGDPGVNESVVGCEPVRAFMSLLSAANQAILAFLSLLSRR